MIHTFKKLVGKIAFRNAKKIILFFCLISILSLLPVQTLAQSAAAIGTGAGAGALTGAAVGSVVPGVGTAIGAGVGAVVGGVAGAFGSNLLGDLAFTVVGKTVFFFSYIISFILGLGVAIEAWLIGAILNINTNLVNSAPVKFGFPVSLSVVNLGFVLGIIVIAIATILRYEAYGMKKILIKLVAAAILVNFSLVIAGVILNFSDQLTGFFLESINPAGSVGGATNGLTSSNNFASAIAGAFNPQRNFITKLNTLNADDQASLASSFGGAIGKMLTPITSLVFVVFSLILIVITLFALIVMLIIRYVYIGILLVIMPFAWLLWVFPSFQSSWNKWWHNFLKWTFFAPIVVFFLWLGIQTSAQISNGAQGTYNFAIYASDSNPFWKAISEVLTNVFSPIVENFLQMAIVLGLMIGGLFAANSFGITFANTAMGGAKTLGKMVGGGLGRWAGNKGLQYAGAPFRRKGPEAGAKSSAEKIQNWAANRKNPLLRYGAGWAARGITRLSTVGGQDLVKSYGKHASSMSDPDLIAAVNSSTLAGPKKIAYMNELGKRNILDAGKMDYTHRKETKELFKNFNQSEEYEKNIEKRSGINSEAYEAMKRGADQQEINRIMGEFAKRWGKGDPANMQLNDLHSGVAGKFGLTQEAIEKLAKANAYGFAAAAPYLASGALAQMKTQSLKNFAGGENIGGDYREGIDDAERNGVIDAREQLNRHEQFNRIIASNIFITTPGTTPPPTAPPAAPGTP